MHDRARQLVATDTPVALLVGDSVGGIVDTVGEQLADVRLLVDGMIDDEQVNTCETVLTPYTQLIRQLVNEMQVLYVLLKIGFVVEG